MEIQSLYWLRKVGDDISRLENQLARVTVLFQLAIDPRFDTQIIDIAYRLFSYDSGSKRTKSVHRFAQKELSTVFILLPVTSWYVLGYCVTEYVIFGLVIVKTFALFPDNYRELALPVYVL